MLEQAIEKSADELETASQATAIATAAAEFEIRARNLPETVRNDDGTTTTQGQNPDGSWRVPECIDCGIDIPLLRLTMGRVRCVGCQTLKEKRQKGY